MTDTSRTLRVYTHRFEYGLCLHHGHDLIPVHDEDEEHLDHIVPQNPIKEIFVHGGQTLSPYTFQKVMNHLFKKCSQNLEKIVWKMDQNFCALENEPHVLLFANYLHFGAGRKHASALVESYCITFLCKKNSGNPEALQVVFYCDCSTTLRSSVLDTFIPRFTLERLEIRNCRWGREALSWALICDAWGPLRNDLRHLSFSAPTALDDGYWEHSIIPQLTRNSILRTFAFKAPIKTTDLARLVRGSNRSLHSLHLPNVVAAEEAGGLDLEQAVKEVTSYIYHSYRGLERLKISGEFRSLCESEEVAMLSNGNYFFYKHFMNPGIPFSSGLVRAIVDVQGRVEDGVFGDQSNQNEAAKLSEVFMLLRHNPSVLLTLNHKAPKQTESPTKQNRVFSLAFDKFSSAFSLAVGKRSTLTAPEMPQPNKRKRCH